MRQWAWCVWSLRQTDFEITPRGEAPLLVFSSLVSVQSLERIQCALHEVLLCQRFLTAAAAG